MNELDMKLDEILGNILDNADKTRDAIRDVNIHDDVKTTIKETVRNVKALVRMVKNYDNQAKKTIDGIVLMNKQLNEYKYKWLLAEAVLDNELANAVSLIADKVNSKAEKKDT